MGIILGLLAAITWGAADFCARYASHRMGAYLTLFFMQFVGLIGLGFYLLGSGQLQFQVMHTSWQPWIWALLAVALNIVSSLALYRAFVVGSLVLVSPIAASYAAVTVVLAFLSGEVLTSGHEIALGLVFAGILIAATPFEQLRKRNSHLFLILWITNWSW